MSELVPQNSPERLPNEGPLIQVGDWYWVTLKEDPEFFACVVKIGSNFVEFEDPYENHERVHFDEFEKRCRKESDPEKVIRERQGHFQGIVREKLGEIQKLTARLGLTKGQHLGGGQPSESRALSVLSETADVGKYKKSLIQAKEKDLPALFEEVEKANKNLALWMQAQALPAKALAEEMEDVVEVITDRVFNISLYAGLTEDVVQFAKGKPAEAAEKLRILQRLLYMDEECLLNYRHGGMDFDDIKEFDSWLAKPENRDRALPFPRSIVAFRVRREMKERDWGGSLTKAFINIQLENLDKLTFLFIRNGENLYRMNCDLEFDDLIFPSRHESDLSEPMVAEMFASSVQKIIPKRTFDDMLEKHKEGEKKYKEWEKAHPKKSLIDNPYREFSFYGSFRPQSYHPFNPSSIYYDDIKKKIEKRIQYFNRIAMIVQGLFDRSVVLHPHPPVQLWSPEGFAAAVELIYDGSNLLHYGKAPDFEAYRERCNQSLGKGSITVGQDRFWTEREGEKESRRMDNDWRTKTDYRPKTHRPYGNPGPGYLAQVEGWVSGKRMATFKWIRKRQTRSWDHDYDDPVNARLVVPETHLFNVSAYRKGDFKQFFEDPRTRMHYLQWAPMLLAAEEYLAGNLKLKDFAKEEV